MKLRAGTRSRPQSCRIRSMCGAMSAAWNPGDLTGLAATLLPAESLARGLLWQNTAKTVPAVADGDPVRVAVCPYTAVEFTAPSDAARPLLWEEGGGLWALAFDGIDDRLPFTVGAAVTAFTVGAAFRPASLASFYAVVGQDDQYALGFTGANAYLSAGGGVSVNQAAGLSAGAQARVIARRSGTAVRFTSGGTTGAGLTLGANDARQLAVVGNRLDGALPYSGRISGFVGCLASLSDADVTLLDTFLGAL